MTSQNNSTPDDVHNQKEVAFYAACMEAWINTRMEKGRHLVTLSSLAIGLLVVFHDKLFDNIDFYLWVISAVTFLLCIIGNLIILAKNAPYLECVTKEDNEKAAHYEKLLNCASRFSDVSFVLGIILTLILTISLSNFVHIKIEKEVPHVEQQQ
ncbi:MAG TPA: hypothetical protein PLE43_08215 [Alphaproteobacteria bacterium]|nr:hypothetical protein [Alphaproteobacteria bacterium]